MVNIVIFAVCLTLAIVAIGIVIAILSLRPKTTKIKVSHIEKTPSKQMNIGARIPPDLPRHRITQTPLLLPVEQRPKKVEPAPQPFVFPARRPTQPVSQSVSQGTRSQLLAMVQGDVAMAQRLVNLVKNSRPGQAEEWYWQKAIEDLARDRR